MRPTIAALVAVPLLVAGAVACGGSSDPGVAPSPSGGADGPTSDLAFTRCMRQHGIDMPDPNPDLWGLDAARTLELDQLPQWDAALEACADLLPPGALQDPGPSAQDLDQLLAFAACMRAHDIEISDPDPDGAMTLGGRLADLSRTQVENDPEYKAAYAACQDKLRDRAGTRE